MNKRQAKKNAKKEIEEGFKELKTSDPKSKIYLSIDKILKEDLTFND